MARNLIAIIWVVLSLPSGARAAGFYTGNSILPYCNNNMSHIYGYVAGVIDKANDDADFIGATYIGLFRELKDNQKFVVDIGKLQDQVLHYCIPENVVLSQVGDVFCKYLKDKPEIRQNRADQLLSDALKAAFPCKK